MSKHSGLGYPSKNLVKEIRYSRKAAVAFVNNHRIRYFIYTKLSKYYEHKHYKEIMSS